MTLVRRRRRNQQALRLLLPPRLPSADLRRSLARPPPTPPPPPPPPTSTNCTTPTSPEDLEKLYVLGHGTGGTVYKVRHLESAVIYALKVLRLDRSTAPNTFRHLAAREAEILERVDSEFIVKCHAVFYSTEEELCFVMEHMERGSLNKALRTRGKLSEEVISRIAESVLKGLKYLHGTKIVHGDIKPSNLLINERGEVKIADFGVSRIIGGSGTRNSACESSMGTCAYMSPERVDPENWVGADSSCNCEYGYAGDVWSLGVVVLECLVGHYPFIGIEEKPDWAALMYAICFGEATVEEMAEGASEEFRSFVRRCLEKDWRNRGRVEELLVHPFVSRTSINDDGSSNNDDNDNNINKGLIDFPLQT